MKSIVLIFLFINIPFWGYCQNYDFNKSKDSIKRHIFNDNRSKLDTLNNKSNGFVNNKKKEVKLNKEEIKSRINSDSIKQKTRAKIDGQKGEIKEKLNQADSITRYNILKVKEKANTDSLKKNVNSVLKKEKREVVSEIVEVKSKFNKDSIKQNTKTIIESQKKELTSNFSIKGKDSLVRNKITGLKEKSNIDSIKKQAKTKIKNQLVKNTKLEFNGYINSESNFSSVPAPFSQYKNNYQRITLDLGINVLGIPFKAEGNWGNDNSPFYPSNSIKISYDASFLSKPENIGKGITQKLDQSKSDYLQKIKNKEQEFTEMNNKKEFYDQRKSYYENQKAQEIEELKRKYNDTIYKKLVDDKVSDLDKSKYLDSIKNKNPDFELPESSVFNQYLSNVKELNRLDSCKSGLMNKWSGVREKWNQDSAKLASDIGDAESKARNLKENPKSLTRYPLSFLKNLKDVQIGIVNPKFTELSLNGVTLKGFSAEFSSKKYRIIITNGKTFSFREWNNTNRTYDLPIHGAYLGFKIKKSEVFVNGVQMKETLEKNYQNISNQVIGGGYKINLFKNFLLSSSEIQKAIITRTPLLQFDNNFKEKTDSSIYINRLKTWKDFAFATNLELGNQKTGKLKVNYRNIQPGFENHLVPYLRKDFEEITANYQNRFFKKLLTVRINYKRLHDNLQKIKPYTNTMKGLGFDATGKFKNGFTISASYKPYELSNNNPDTFFRTRNTFSITQINLMYQKAKSGNNYLVNLLCVQNQTNYSNKIAQTYSINFISSNTFKTKYSLDFNYSLNLVPNNQDTLNYSSVGLNFGVMSKTVKKSKIDININSNSMIYKNGHYMHQIKTVIGLRMQNNAQLKLQLGYGISEGIPSMTANNFYTCNIVFRCPIAFNPIKYIKKVKSRNYESKHQQIKTN